MTEAVEVGFVVGGDLRRAVDGEPRAAVRGDLDRATGGRVVLRVGVGVEYPAEFRACQVPVRERGPRTDEAIPLLRRLWAAGTITHDGPYYPMSDVRVHPAPAQPGGPPIVVAGRKEPAMRRAALLGDGWFPYLYSPRRYADSARTVRAVAAEAGRDLTGFGWYVFVFVNVDGDGDRAEAARTMGGTYDQDFGPLVDRVAAAGTRPRSVAGCATSSTPGPGTWSCCPLPEPATPWCAGYSTRWSRRCAPTPWVRRRPGSASPGR